MSTTTAPNRHGFRVGHRRALVDLGGDEPGRRLDLAVHAVEPDLQVWLGLADDEAPGPADPEVDVAHEPLRRLVAPPALHELGRRVRLEDEVGRSVEGAGDEDLGVRGKGDHGGAVPVADGLGGHGWFSWV